MKPFNLEEAKAGKPVCTRDSRKARILCFDVKNKRYPIVAAIEEEDCEQVFTFTSDGKYIVNENSYRDLFMAAEKKTGWINIYKSIHKDSVPIFGSIIYKNKEDAINNIVDKFKLLDTIQITWEE